MAQTTDHGATHRSVLVYLAVNCAEMLALGMAAWATGSVALRAQTAANAAEVAVEVFLLIGVLSSVRPPDDSHPLGYGRERFFWSLFAALGTFVGGAGLAIEEAVRAALHPSLDHSYMVAYLVLAATIALDGFALEVALGPVRKDAASRGRTVITHLQTSTDPAGVTVVVGGGCAVAGGAVAVLGLALSQLAGTPTPDTVASALIGLLLLGSSVLLLRTNRDLLSGRGVPLPMLREMSRADGGFPLVRRAQGTASPLVAGTLGPAGRGLWSCPSRSGRSGCMCGPVRSGGSARFCLRELQFVTEASDGRDPPRVARVVFDARP